jgi:hypothetical protein
MAGLRITERLATMVGAVETSKWAWGTFQVAPMLASFGVTAWAVWAAEIFSQYAPFSWVVAGFCGAAVWQLFRLIGSVSQRIRVRARYDARLLEHGGTFNPLDKTFERRRIYLNDFALPSSPFIEGKTFIDCDIIGPGNMYLRRGNSVNEHREPAVDGVCLHSNASVLNGFIFDNCIFRNCSFQRISIFASIETWLIWRRNQSVRWISPAPSTEEIQARLRSLGTPEAEIADHIADVHPAQALLPAIIPPRP